MTNEQLSAIKARANAATPAPWVFYTPTQKVRSPDENSSICEVYGNADENGEFIAHAREDIPALLEYVKQLESRIETILKLNHQLSMENDKIFNP